MRQPRRRVGISLCLVIVLFASLAAALPSSAEDAPLHFEADGVRVDVATEPFGLTISDGTGRVLVDPPSGGDLFYARGWHLGGLVRDFEIPFVFDLDLQRFRPTNVVAVESVDDGLRITAETSEGDARTATILVTVPGPRRVHVEFDLSSTSGVYRWGARLPAGPGEHFAGLGERFDGVDHRGKDIALGASRAYTGDDFLGGVRIPEQDYAPIPFVVSSRGWGAALWNDGNGVRADVAKRHGDAVELGALTSSGPLSYDVYVGGTGPDRVRTILSDYTADVGRSTVLPEWSYGVWRSKDRFVSQDEVLSDAAAWRDHGIPLDVLVIDSPWETTYNSWRFNPEQFPDAQRMLDTLNDDGVRPVVWMTGWMNVDSTSGDRIEGPDTQRWARQPVEWYEPMADQGLLVSYPDGTPHVSQWWMGKGSAVDFTKPEATSFWTQIARPTIEMGISGLKIDGMEGFYFPDGVRFGDGRTGADGAWSFTADYYEAAAGLLAQARGDDWMTMARAAWHGSGAQSAVWAADQWSSAAGLRQVLSAGLSAGMTGISNWYHDVGGYNGRPPTVADVLGRILSGRPVRGILDLFSGLKPDREVLVRWAQVGAFTPVFQAHSKADVRPWSYDAEVAEIYARYARIHESLVPYITGSARAASETGLPIFRSLAIEQPDHPAAWTTSDAYFFGDAFFVAPVVDPGRRSRTVHLPDGDWVDYWTGQIVDGGGTVTADAPLDRLPLWVRPGAIVPSYPEDVDSLTPALDDAVRQDPVRNNAVQTVDGRLDVRVWPWGDETDSSFTLADGTAFSATPAGLEWTGTPADSIVVRLPSPAAPSAVLAGSEALPPAADLEAVLTTRSGWFHDPSNGDVWAGVSGSAGSVRLVAE